VLLTKPEHLVDRSTNYVWYSNMTGFGEFCKIKEVRNGGNLYFNRPYISIQRFKQGHPIPGYETLIKFDGSVEVVKLILLTNLDSNEYTKDRRITYYPGGKIH